MNIIKLICEECRCEIIHKGKFNLFRVQTGLGQGSLMSNILYDVGKLQKHLDVYNRDEPKDSEILSLMREEMKEEIAELNIERKRLCLKIKQRR